MILPEPIAGMQSTGRASGVQVRSNYPPLRPNSDADAGPTAAPDGLEPRQMYESRLDAPLGGRPFRELPRVHAPRDPDHARHSPNLADWDCRSGIPARVLGEGEDRDAHSRWGRFLFRRCSL